MSWCHCSAADGEACIDGGLLSNHPAMTSVSSTLTADGGVRTVPAVRWCCVAVTTLVVLEQPLACRDLPTQEQEVTSLSVS
jgi:hypothetical protein